MLPAREGVFGSFCADRFWKRYLSLFGVEVIFSASVLAPVLGPRIAGLVWASFPDIFLDFLFINFGIRGGKASFIL